MLNSKVTFYCTTSTLVVVTINPVVNFIQFGCMTQILNCFYLALPDNVSDEEDAKDIYSHNPSTGKYTQLCNCLL